MCKSIRTKWLSSAGIVGLLALCGPLLSIGYSQSTMPDGWQILSAEDFAQEADLLLSSATPPTAEHLQEVVSHAWDQFLTDETFASTGNIETVLKIIDLFGGKRPEEIDVSVVEQLQASVSARLSNESTDLSGLDLYDLGNIAKGILPDSAEDDLQKVGGEELTNPGVFVRWMQANDWEPLETQHLYNLFGFVNADAIDRRRFSARWSGSITAPQTDDYVFRQARVYLGDDSRLKIWIDGTLVLDSSNGENNPDAFSSAPVHFTGGQPVSFQAELVHDTKEIEYGASAPMALITWESDTIDQQLIPASAFTPPDDFVAQGSVGLKGEYFSDTNFANLSITRLDPTLDMVWSWDPAAPVEADAAQEVFAVIVGRLLDDAYMNQIAGESDEVVAIEFDRNLWRIAYRMSATERLELISVLMRNPAVLSRLSPEAVGRLFRALYMLPGDSQLDLIGEWALARPQPRCLAGWFPGWGDGGYQKLNTDFYWAIGHMLQGPYAEDVQYLWDNHLIRPDGECNLPVANATAFAAHNNEQGEELLARIKERIDDTSLSGDQVATWYIARAFAKGALTSRLQPLRGLPDLQGALISSDSDDYAFWALQEMVARLSSLNKCDRAKELIELHSDQFNLPSQQATMAQWIVEADGLEATYTSQEAAGAEEAQLDYLAELKRRRQLTPEDSSDATRLDALIETVEAASSSP